MTTSWLSDEFDERYMHMALLEAQMAAEEGEVPVGAVMVHPEHGIIARAHNEKETLRDATAHAEILAIGQASQAVDAWRLTGTTLYTTLEPCAMCAGAIVQARIGRVVFGAADPKAGAVVSVLALFARGLFNHDVEWTEGVLEEPCSEILTRFFEEKRRKAARENGSSNGAH